MKKTHKNVFTGILYEKFVTSLNYRKFISEKMQSTYMKDSQRIQPMSLPHHPILQTKKENSRGYASIDSTNCNNEATRSV